MVLRELNFVLKIMNMVTHVGLSRDGVLLAGQRVT